MKIGIVGAGVFGLAAAIELRARGHEVSVFDQGTAPYASASSTDVSKGIRRTWYAGDNDTYVELVERAAAQWRAWERRVDESFYHQVGGLKILDSFEPGDPMYASVEYLRGMGAEIEVLSPAEARSRFPQFRIADNQTCVYDGWGGYIESGRAVSIMARIAREEGAELRESILVSAVDELSSHVEVVHGGGRDRFDRVVVAAGCWVGRLLPEIGAGVKVSHQQMLLIVPVEPAAFAHGAMPCWSIDPDGEGWYGFPLLREGYVKISKEPLGDTVDPDIDREGTQDFADLTLAFLRERIPEMAEGRVAGGRSCLYTATPDDHFMVDWSPGRSRVIVAGGGSGHGFKFGGSIGPVIADALEDKHNPLGDRFRLGSRFTRADRSQEPSRGFARPTAFS